MRKWRPFRDRLRKAVGVTIGRIIRAVKYHASEPRAQRPRALPR